VKYRYKEGYQAIRCLSMEATTTTQTPAEGAPPETPVLTPLQARMQQKWCFDWPWSWTSCGYAIAGITMWLFGFLVAVSFVLNYRKRGWRLWNVLFILGFFLLAGMAYYVTKDDDKNPETGQISMRFGSQSGNMLIASGAGLVLLAWAGTHIFLRSRKGQELSAAVSQRVESASAKVGAAKQAVVDKVGTAKQAVVDKVGAAKQAVVDKVGAAKDKVLDAKEAAQLKLVEKLTPVPRKQPQPQAQEATPANP